MIKRPRLLNEAPRDTAESLEELLGVANAIEVEAVARYDQLAQLMEQRGETETADIFRDMREIEKRHVDMVAQQASALQQEVPSSPGFIWRLPSEIGRSWDEVRNSSLLTPYRALAIAVTNEERAFVLYSYITAQASDPAVMELAETLAREELAHAAELRVRRRQAYRRETAGRIGPAAAGVESLADFQDLERRFEADAGAIHLDLSRVLEAAGDGASAALLADLARRENDAARNAAHAGGVAAAPRKQGAKDAPPGTEALLLKALRPLESASEAYEDVIGQTDREDLLSAAQSALRRTVEHMSLLRARIDDAGFGS